MGMPPLEYKKMKKGGLPIILIQYLLHPGRCGIGIANLATQLQQLALHLFDFTFKRLRFVDGYYCCSSSRFIFSISPA